DIADRSWLAGIFLAGGTWLALQSFIEYPSATLVREFAPIINLGLIAVVWWSARMLVRDCTGIDEDMEVIGEGLMQAAGMDRSGAGSPPDAQSTKIAPAIGSGGWWQR